MSKSDRYSVIIRPTALDDLKGISVYIENHSLQNAPIVIGRILRSIESLEIMPRRTKRVGKTRSRGTPVHTFVEYPYLIYYSVEARSRAVVVFAIRHGSRRQPRRFE